MSGAAPGDLERLSATIIGRVQGVGFRWWVRSAADRMGLTGWVMNGADERSVELVAEGPAASLDQLERLLREGPPGAVVDRVRGHPLAGVRQLRALPDHAAVNWRAIGCGTLAIVVFLAIGLWGMSKAFDRLEGCPDRLQWGDRVYLPDRVATGRSRALPRARRWRSARPSSA